ncbi:cytokine receptor-like [Anticarsia gemmatalis]|uniref:cytokine receptor-like n=1 Tax=Anticarsia gemmatalis TaxID=129554 RepID=UPI003F776707
MANICTNERRNQCNGFRRRPQFGQWMWCIILKCLISLPCIFSSCHGVNISVTLVPSGMIYIPYGDPLDILCIAEEGRAEDLEFYHGGEPLDSEIVNATARRLFRKNIEKQVTMYYCHNNATNKKCTTRVLVDGPPSNVTNFSCISKNLDELNCTWPHIEKYSTTNYTMSYMFQNRLTKSSPAKLIGNTWSCVWTTTTEPAYRQVEEYYFIQLKACNYFGCNRQNFTIDHFAIVKPDKPSNLKIIGNNTHSVQLQWNIPNNMVDLLQSVVHKIEYQIAKIDNTSYFRTVDTSHLPVKSKTYKFTLTDLPYAHMLYEVRIYIKSSFAKDDKYWSDFTYEFFTTASERPQRPPDTTVGAFAQSVYNDHNQYKRVVYVYWKQLEEYEEGADNFTYKVVATQNSRRPQTLLPDKNKSLSYVILQNASLDAIDVYIWSTNDIGSSENGSHLFIPSKKDTEALSVPSFTKLAYENGTYKLSWIGIEGIDNYTLFWCQHNSTQICAGRMNFTVLDPNKNTHVIHLPRENRYQFAISANSGFKTSGMTWASCDISKDAIPMYGFPVKLDHDAPGTTYVKINWTMSCTLQEGIIIGYVLNYCPVLDTSTVCDQSYGNKSQLRYINDPNQKEINITDLKPYRTYQFWLQMDTTYGLKTIENALTGVTTTEDTPSSPRNVKISDVQYNSLNISWDPPLHKNGIIWEYKILNYGKEFIKKSEKVPVNDKDNTRSLVIGDNLIKPYTNYSLSVKACNAAIDKCSEPSPKFGIFVRTRIGPPSQIKTPSANVNSGTLKWERPSHFGGIVDHYQIKRIKDDGNTAEYITTTDLEYHLIYCEGAELSESYQVRAVNLDTDPNHGILEHGDVILPDENDKGPGKFEGEWSDKSSVTCGSRDGITMTLILLAVFAIIGVMYGSIKLYKKVRKMEDIKPVLPNGLGIPEKESKYVYGGLYSTNKDEKPSSDEMLLLPNSRTTVSTPENKQNTDNNCGSSEHTDSTALSDTSRGPIERHASTSDDGSDSSLHLEVEPIRADDNNASHDEEDSSNSETDNSRGNSPYLNDNNFKKNPSGYVQSVVNPGSGYVQSAPAPHKSPLAQPTTQPTSSSYVMAALSPPIFTTGVAPPTIPSQPPASSGYVRPEDAQAKSMMNFPKLGPSPTKVFGSESLPTMPTLPQPVKHGADSSYIQLQSLDALTSHKQPVRSNVPLKPTASSGYVSPGDAVINKHLNNMLSGGTLAEESAILDPTMSPDAYCRFSWSTDPANDNLHSLLTDSHTLKSSKN